MHHLNHRKNRCTLGKTPSGQSSKPLAVTEKHVIEVEAMQGRVVRNQAAGFALAGKSAVALFPALGTLIAL